MFRVGLSGGIGSGKTTVSKVFQTLGIPVFYADDTVKKLYDTDKRLQEAMLNLFGPTIYDKGQLQPKILAALIFNNDRLLRQVNELTHTLLSKAFTEWMQEQKAPYVLHEAAILFECGMAGEMDINISISAPESIRIARVIQRDGSSEEQIRQRISKQWSDEERNAKADYIIINDNKEALLPQITAIHKKIITLV
ncbi:MAG: dephospho-CoA kinase [Prevotellaceae bacterium]|jgi:dephospho-CoA kinase|nr:dephospho-CoA kinase [Prevotellaceae bacterium]